MPHRDWKFRIQDILDAISAIQNYTQGIEFKSFSEDRRTVDAVVRNLIIIGEAAVHIPDDVCLEYPNVPWYDMRGMRNIVVHEYFQADDAIIWDTIHVDLPTLPDLLKKLLEDSPDCL